MMAESNGARRLSPRKRPNFTVRSAASDPSFGSMNPSNTIRSEQDPAMQGGSNCLDNPYGPLTSGSPPSFHRAWEVYGGGSRIKEPDQGPEAAKGRRRSSGI